MNIKIRKASPEDLNDLIRLLSQLTTVGYPTNLPSDIYNDIYVAYDNESKNIVGTIKLLFENKIIHDGSSVLHVEDVVVDENYRGLGVGKLLLDYGIYLAEKRGCYKVILDCDEENIEFYEKCGFRNRGVCMRYDI